MPVYGSLNSQHTGAPGSASPMAALLQRYPQLAEMVSYDGMPPRQGGPRPGPDPTAPYGPQTAPMQTAMASTMPGGANLVGNPGAPRPLPSAPEPVVTAPPPSDLASPPPPVPLGLTTDSMAGSPDTSLPEPMMPEIGGGGEGIAASLTADEPASAPPADDGSGGGGGSTVICTELFRQGYIPQDVWVADGFYGDHVAQFRPDVYRGYLRVAAPLARAMARSSVLTRMVAIVAVPWAYEMFYGKGHPQCTRLGGLVVRYGEAVCAWLGRGKGIRCSA